MGATIYTSERLLLEELFYRIESVPSWNPTLVECKTIQPIDEHTDISYQVRMDPLLHYKQIYVAKCSVSFGVVYHLKFIW